MRSRDERGMTTISYILATGLSLIVITWCALFVIHSYTRAVIRDAAARATRAASVRYTLSHNESEVTRLCEETFYDVLRESLNMRLSSHVLTECRITETKVTLHATGQIPHINSAFPFVEFNEISSRYLEDVPR